MEKTQIGRMNIVNTRVKFDSYFFIKGNGQKLVYKIRNRETKNGRETRLFSNSKNGRK